MMHKSHCGILLAIFACWLVLQVNAQPNYQVKKIEFNTPTSDNGAKQLCYDSTNGTIWFYNSKGVYRFNGKQLTHINFLHPTGKTLNGHSISGIKYHHGFIYVATDSGIAKLNQSGEVNWLKLFITPVKINDFDFVNNQELIVLTSKGYLILNPDQPHLKIHYVIDSKTTKLLPYKKHIYVAVEDGGKSARILKFDTKLNLEKQYYLQYGIYAKTLSILDNKVIVSANHRLMVYQHKTDSFIPAEYKFASLVLANKNDSNAGVFVEYPNKVSHGNYIKNKIINKKEINLGTNVIVYDLLQLPNHDYLIGTNSGIYLLYKNTLNYKIIDKGISYFPDYLKVRREVIEDNDYLYYLYYGGVLRENKKSKQITPLYIGEIYAYAGLVDEHNIWIGTDGAYNLGCLNKRSGEINWFKYNKEYYKGLVISSLLEGNKDEIIIACNNRDHLVVFDKNLKSFKEVALFWQGKKLNNFYVRKLSKTIHGDILLASSIGLIVLDSRLVVKHFFTIPHHLSSENNQEINYVYQAPNKHIWLCTDNGLIELDEKYRHIQEVDLNGKLKDRKCIFITQDYSGVFWTATYNGLYGFVFVGNNAQAYFISNNLPDNEFNFNACKQLKNGEIILGGLNAYIKISKQVNSGTVQKKQLNFSAPVIYNDKGEKVNMWNWKDEKITINKGLDVLQLSFAVNDYINPELCNYYYKIEGNSEWIPIGSSGFLQIWNLPDRNNTILVKGIDSQGIECSNILSIDVFFNTPFYEAKWFLAFIIILIAALIIVFIVNRHNQMQKLRTIKSALLYDIHDEIGSILTKTSMHTDLMVLHRKSDTKDLRFISRNIKEAMQALRNVLWSLDAEDGNLNNLIDRARANLSFIFDGTPLEYHVENNVYNDRFDVSIEMKRNILLIIKEAATNTLKYSNGNLFMVCFSIKEKRLLISINDNGNCSIPLINESGYGLDGIEKRVKSLKGTLSIRADQTGFNIDIIL